MFLGTASITHVGSIVFVILSKDKNKKREHEQKNKRKKRSLMRRFTILNLQCC